MIEYLLVGFVLGVVCGAINRISSTAGWVICIGLTGWGIGRAGSVKAYGELLWGWETAVAAIGAAPGMAVGYLAIDRAIMWLEER
jgi:hypothetical protein